MKQSLPYSTRPAHAQLAIADLEAAGVPSSSIQHYAHETYDATHSSTGSHNTGFWAWLIGEDSTEHHDLYNTSLTSGSTVVTVITDGDDNDRVVSILEQHAPVDLEERGSQYGLTSGTATGTTYGATTGATTGATSSATTGAGTTAAATDAYATTAASGTAPAGKGLGEEVITLAEEALTVGKREIDRGTTRVRRYVVERPVEELVRLRDETVSVFRRPATGATVGQDAFTDKTISVKETAEEAVVSKTAHVVEEVVVKKQVNERDQKISDTVRREEVEITGPGGHRCRDGQGPLRHVRLIDIRRGVWGGWLISPIYLTKQKAPAPRHAGDTGHIPPRTREP